MECGQQYMSHSQMSVYYYVQIAPAAFHSFDSGVQLPVTKGKNIWGVGGWGGENFYLPTTYLNEAHLSIK